MERLILILAVLCLTSGCGGDQEPAALSIPPTGDETAEPAPRSYDLRTVSREELEQIPGLNRNHVQGILKFQISPGFRRVEDLLAVKGIGEKTWLKIRRYFHVSDQAGDSGQ